MAYQVSLRYMLGLVIVSASWLGLRLIAPDFAMLLLGTLITVMFAILRKKVELLFWAPFFTSINWMLMLGNLFYIPQVELWVLGSLILFLAINVFAVTKTFAKYREVDNSDDAMFHALYHYVFGAFLSGLMISTSVIAIGVPIFLFGGNSNDIPWLIGMSILPAILLAVFGACMGIVLMFPVKMSVDYGFRRQRAA